MDQARPHMSHSSGEVHEGLVGTVGHIGQDVQETVEKVTDSVEKATADLSETGASIGVAIHESVENVKAVFDPVGLMRRHPWSAFAGCVFAGFLLGDLLSPGR